MSLKSKIAKLLENWIITTPIYRNLKLQRDVISDNFELYVNRVDKALGYPRPDTCALQLHVIHMAEIERLKKAAGETHEHDGLTEKERMLVQRWNTAIRPQTGTTELTEA